MQLVDKGIVAAKGFEAAGIHCGIKKAKKDLAIVYSEAPCQYAGAFTTNIIQAAPVLWDKEVLEEQEPVHAVIVNSGNANAVTGEKGYENTLQMAGAVGEVLGINKEEVLVCSTGVIGVQLPMENILTGIPKACSEKGSTKEKANDAAQAIMTTDTITKEIAIAKEIDGKVVTVGAMGKGSGMIHPNMATLLGFVCTDINITQRLLQKALKRVVNNTFNMITVDGDTSTNDTVIALANGEAGNTLISYENDAFEQFCEMLEEVLKYVAISIVKDGEGATKFIEVNIKEANDKQKAKNIAKSILTSNLVKTAFFGADANWGRIICAMGYSGEKFDSNRMTLSVESVKGRIELFRYGRGIVFDEEKAKDVLSETEIKVFVTLNEGDVEVTAWGCDLSYDYVKINGDYRS